MLTKTTKFNDLPEDVKRDLEGLEYVFATGHDTLRTKKVTSSVIQSQIQISKELHQRKLGEEPLKGYELIKSVHKVCYEHLRST